MNHTMNEQSNNTGNKSLRGRCTQLTCSCDLIFFIFDRATLVASLNFGLLPGLEIPRLGCLCSSNSRCILNGSRGNTRNIVIGGNSTSSSAAYCDSSETLAPQCKEPALSRGDCCSSSNTFGLPAKCKGNFSKPANRRLIGYRKANDAPHRLCP